MYKCHPIFLSWGKGWVELAVPTWRCLLPSQDHTAITGGLLRDPGQAAGGRQGQRPSGGREWHLLCAPAKGKRERLHAGGGRSSGSYTVTFPSFTKQKSKLQNSINVRELRRPRGDKTNRREGTRAGFS